MTTSFHGPQEPELQAGAPALRALAVAGFDANGVDADAFKSPSAFFASLGVTERTVMRHQVVELIIDILSATDPASEVRLRLLRHLAAHPGCPEQALLCHLRENAQLPLPMVPGLVPAEPSDARSADAFGGCSPGGQSQECGLANGPVPAPGLRFPE